MFEYLSHLTSSAFHAWARAVVIVLPSLAFFVLLALLMKGKEALAAFERAFDDIRVNFSLYFLDAILVAPWLAVLAKLIQDVVASTGLALIAPARWAAVPSVVILVGVVLAGDFVSYWRHRLEHTRLLWPAHAIHHSDAHMTWTTLGRFHPFNRLSTEVIDLGILAVLGFPHWALVANFMVRHYYGEFIHADLPWMYGRFRYVFVSPVMHRWHHARDVVGAGSNFATVFAFIDYGFGTYHVPGLCDVPLGVNDEMGKGTIGQMLYPFKAWGARLRDAREPASAAVDETVRLSGPRA